MTQQASASLRLSLVLHELTFDSLMCADAVMLEALGELAASQSWVLFVAVLSLLSPVFAILHFLHFMLFVPDDEAEDPQAAAAAPKNKKNKKAD